MRLESLFLLPSAPPRWQRFSWHHLSRLMTIYFWMSMMTARWAFLKICGKIDNFCVFARVFTVVSALCLDYQWLSVISAKNAMCAARLAQQNSTLRLYCPFLHANICCVCVQSWASVSDIFCARLFHIHVVWQLPVFIEISGSSGITRCMAVSNA